MPDLELKQCFTVKGDDRCYHSSLATQDRVWVSEIDNIMNNIKYLRIRASTPCNLHLRVVPHTVV